MNVLILCAGYGTRLAPLSDHVAKPLLPLAGRSVLQRQQESVSKIPGVHIVVNAHHLADQVEKHALQLGIEHVFVEETILGTAGPMCRMFREGWTDDLLVVNGDILHDFDLKAFAEAAKNAEEDVVLLGIDHPAVNTVAVDSKGRVCGIKDCYGEDFSGNKGFTFTGVSWYSSATLARLKKEHFSAVSFWKSEYQEGRLARMISAKKDALWIDMGTPAGLLNAAFICLKKDGGKALNVNDGETCLKECIVEGGNDFCKALACGTILKHCLLLPGARILRAASYENAVIGKDFLWETTE